MYGYGRRTGNPTMDRVMQHQQKQNFDSMMQWFFSLTSNGQFKFLTYLGQEKKRVDFVQKIKLAVVRMKLYTAHAHQQMEREVRRDVMRHRQNKSTTSADYRISFEKGAFRTFLGNDFIRNILKFEYDYEVAKTASSAEESARGLIEAPEKPFTVMKRFAQYAEDRSGEEDSSLPSQESVLANPDDADLFGPTKLGYFNRRMADPFHYNMQYDQREFMEQTANLQKFAGQGVGNSQRSRAVYGSTLIDLFGMDAQSERIIGDGRYTSGSSQVNLNYPTVSQATFRSLFDMFGDVRTSSDMATEEDTMVEESTEFEDEDTTFSAQFGALFDMADTEMEVADADAEGEIDAKGEIDANGKGESKIVDVSDAEMEDEYVMRLTPAQLNSLDDLLEENDAEDDVEGDEELLEMDDELMEITGEFNDYGLEDHFELGDSSHDIPAMIRAKDKDSFVTMLGGNPEETGSKSKARLIAEKARDVQDDGDDAGDSVFEAFAAKSNSIYTHRYFKEVVLRMSRNTILKKGGRAESYSCILMLATHNFVGVGFGQASGPTTAQDKAKLSALRNLRSIRMDPEGILFNTVHGKFKKSHCMIHHYKEPGVRGHPILSVIAESMGLNYITIKTYGNDNLMNVIPAFFNACDQIQTREQHCSTLGVLAAETKGTIRDYRTQVRDKSVFGYSMKME